MIQEEEMHFVWTSVTHDPHLKQCEYGRFRGGNGRRRGRGVKRLNCKSVYWKWNGRGVMELMWKKRRWWNRMEDEFRREVALFVKGQTMKEKNRIDGMNYKWVYTILRRELRLSVEKKQSGCKSRIYDWRSLDESSYYSKNGWKGRQYSERFHSTYKVLSSNFTLILISSLWVWFNSLQNNGS